MKSTGDFYQALHESQQDYSAGTYHMQSFWSSRALQGWLKNRNSIRILDVGCGKGLFLRDLVRGLEQRCNLKPSRITGVDMVRSPDNLFELISPNFEFIQHDTDGNALPFSDNAYDFICCNHVLEHVFETEKLVREFHRVLALDGFCIISVPNIAAWVNRVAFLWGGQPLGSELGTEDITYGFRPAFLHSRLERFKPSGHIRDFTPRGLRDLAEHCGFRVVGWWAQSHGVLARLGKWAGRNMSIMLQPAS